MFARYLPNGDLDTCIAIRTIVLANGVAHLQAGAGIVADSDPSEEHEECLRKLAALETAFAQVDIAQANVAATTEDMRVQQERYRVGAATILDLLTSQANLTQAQVSLVQARFNYVIARATLEALVGRAL